MQILTLSISEAFFFFAQLGSERTIFPHTTHMWLAKNVTVPIIMTPASMVDLPYGLCVWAPAV